MMYRGKPGTGTPLIEFDQPPADGPIIGYSPRFRANLYTYARNNPVNLIDPSGLEPEYMTREWFQWFVRWDIPSYLLERNPEWDARLTREADDLFDEVDALATDVFSDLTTAEARRQSLLMLRAYNESMSAQSGAINIDPNADPGLARTNAATEMEENLILAGEGWWTRKLHIFMIPGAANPNPVNFDTTLAAVAAGRVAQVGMCKGTIRTPLSPNARSKHEPKAVVPALAWRGVWGKGPGIRGELIEKRLGQNLPQPFKIIDRFENGVATSIKSMDLWTQTFRNADNITRTGRGYIDKVAVFEGASSGKTMITSLQVRVRALDLAVPPGASPAQRLALQGLVTYGRQKGVFVNIIVIKY